MFDGRGEVPKVERGRDTDVGNLDLRIGCRGVETNPALLELDVVRVLGRFVGVIGIY